MQIQKRIRKLSLGCWETDLRIFVIYRKPGGSTEAILFTESIVDAIIEEMEAEPYTPTMIVGDLNAEPKRLTNIKELIEEENWTDLGANAIFWGGTDSENTCLSRAGAEPSRIDAAVVCPEAFKMVSGFKVEKIDDIPTHASIQVKIQQKPKSRNEDSLENPTLSQKALRRQNPGNLEGHRRSSGGEAAQERGEDEVAQDDRR